MESVEKCKTEEKRQEKVQTPSHTQRTLWITK